MKTTNFGTAFMVEDSPCFVTPLPGQTYIKKLIQSVNLAKYSIDIIQYQWHFYPFKPDCLMQQLNRTLLAKIQSGCKVRVLLNKEGRSAEVATVNMNASKFLAEAGAIVKFGRSFPITHAKLWVFDDDAVMLGSHNLSTRAITVNNESSALIKGREVAMEFKRYFDVLWNLV
jgi:phosphatidylserine/phosphatidylglycerophosphate/cardiolipin synthase-like enzyme